ncbi:MAG: hypothetical protein ACJ8AT_20380, partial [Hyalangium sp.]|uniref:hypothetical protein n=1 Tax=Hyalangium sp. TaxID=2028555 RepID=UPI0038999028
MPEFFEIWAAGNPVTNQDSAVTGARSGLVGWRLVGAAGNVRDDQLAGMAAPAVQGGTRFIWAFGQCFGGGMFDELVALGGTQSGTSASRHNETSRYPKRPPNGVGHDWVTRYLGAMAAGNTARTTAASAAANDPFGTNPGAPRFMEVMGTEHPQYFSVGAGADNQMLFQAGGIAILWSGQPTIYDRDQIVAALGKLVAMGYTRDRIFVYYGSGRLRQNHPIVQGHIINPATGMLLNPPITLRAATQNALSGLFAMRFGPNAQCKPGSVFFLSNDHGFNTSINLGAAAPRGSDIGDPDAYPDPDAEDDYGDYGDGDSGLYGFAMGTCPCDGGVCMPPDAGTPP